MTFRIYPFLPPWITKIFYVISLLCLTQFQFKNLYRVCPYPWVLVGEACWTVTLTLQDYLGSSKEKCQKLHGGANRNGGLLISKTFSSVPLCSIFPTWILLPEKLLWWGTRNDVQINVQHLRPLYILCVPIIFARVGKKLPGKILFRFCRDCKVFPNEGSTTIIFCFFREEGVRQMV